MPDIKQFEPYRSYPDVCGQISERRVCLCTDIGKIIIRGNRNDAAFHDGIKSVIGELPAQVGQVSTFSDGKIFWLGPNEWILHCELSKVDLLIQKLKESVFGVFSQIIDVSEYYQILKITSDNIRTLLSKWMVLDLHETQFAQGAAYSSCFAKASVMVHLPDQRSAYLQVRWSYLEYVYSLLAEGMREPGL